MVACRLIFMDVKNYTINFSPIRHNRNTYLREDNNSGDDFNTFLPDESNFNYTVIPENKSLRNNNIPVKQRFGYTLSSH